MKPEVTVGIPAYNEEKNIASLLRSILTQKLQSISLSKIIVISDGSTDNTSSEVLSLKCSQVKLISHKKRMGKSVRMNEFMKMSDTEYIIFLDADIEITNPSTLEKLLRPMKEQNEVSLTSGRTSKKDSYTFFDKLMTVSDYLQNSIKNSINKGDNVYSCHGRIVGLRKNLYKELTIPPNSAANDAFLYLKNKQKGFGFVYVPQAVVGYKMPQGFNDFIKQRTRYASASTALKREIGPWVEDEYKIPKKVYVFLGTSALLKFHVYFLSYVVLLMVSIFYHGDSSAKWSISESTKSV